MKRLLLFSLIAIAFAISGCSTRGTMTKVDNSIAIGYGARFQNISVENASGHVWKEGEEQIDLAKSLKDAIDVCLQKENMMGNDYVIKTTIVHYDPGNAFKRWLMPGYGSTELTTRSEVYDKENKLIAVIPVERYVGFGGVFSIGAWKRVIDEVAAEIVNVLKQATHRS